MLHVSFGTFGRFFMMKKIGLAHEFLFWSFKLCLQKHIMMNMRGIFLKMLMQWSFFIRPVSQLNSNPISHSLCIFHSNLFRAQKFYYRERISVSPSFNLPRPTKKQTEKESERIIDEEEIHSFRSRRRFHRFMNRTGRGESRSTRPWKIQHKNWIFFDNLRFICCLVTLFSRGSHPERIQPVGKRQSSEAINTCSESRTKEINVVWQIS